MQTFTFRLGGGLRCLAGRNPLVRLVDRFEAAFLLLIMTVVLCAVPVAGAVGTATYDRLARDYAADRATRHSVVATVTEDSTFLPQPYDEPFLTRIGWRAGGVDHTDEVRTYRMKTGDSMTIWVDAQGNPATAPLTDQIAATEAVITGLGLWLATVGFGAVTWALVRLRLNSVRSAAWDRALDDLADDGGRTNHRA